MYPVKFELKYEPTNLKQIAKWPYWFGIILFLLTVLVVMLGQFLPLELYTLYLFELVGKLMLHLITLGTISTVLGLILDRLSWRRGNLTFNEDGLDIHGKKSVNMPFHTFKSILQTNSSKRLIQIDTTHYNAKFKFKRQRDFEILRTLLDKQVEIKTAA
ncbi:MAG: hypothetical protein AAGF85_01480 [Bacteroidota bacterium]